MFNFLNTDSGRSPRGQRRAATFRALGVLACLAVFLGGCPESDKIEDPINETATVSNQPRESTPAPIADPPDPLPVAGRTHIVQQHDTLYKLAEQYYGNSKFYRKILAANKRRLRDPNNLPVGMKLIIP